jgi:hypothetical protein
LVIRNKDYQGFESDKGVYIIPTAKEDGTSSHDDKEIIPTYSSEIFYSNKILSETTISSTSVDSNSNNLTSFRDDLLPSCCRQLSTWECGNIKNIINFNIFINSQDLLNLIQSVISGKSLEIRGNYYNKTDSDEIPSSIAPTSLQVQNKTIEDANMSTEKLVEKPPTTTEGIPLVTLYASEASELVNKGLPSTNVSLSVNALNNSLMENEKFTEYFKFKESSYPSGMQIMKIV